jgi:hypothetical protein
MSSRKRINESGQISKEEYSALENSIGDDGNELDSGISRADDATLKRRKIIRAKRPDDTTTTTTSDATNNPFANVQLFGKSITQSEKKSHLNAFGFSAAGPAPSASFSLGGGGTIKTEGFSFKPPTIAPAAAVNSKPFSFGSAAAADNNNENNNNKSTSTTTKSWKALNSEILSHLVNEKTSLDDWMRVAWNYVEDARVIAKQQGTLSIPKTTSTTQPPKSEAMTAPALVTPTPPTSLFLVNATAANNTMSFGGSKTGSNFAFGASAPSANVMSTTSTSAKTITATTTADNDDEEDDTNTESTDKDFVEQADPDWDDVGVYERIRVYRIENGAWKAFASAGNKLRLQKFKSGDRPLYRMLMRDIIGQKVFLNMTILKDLKFQYAEEKNQKTNTVKAKITFTGINDAEKGNEVFMFVTVPTTGKELHQNLEALASKTT